MKGVKHYKRDGTLHKGSMHKMPNGTIHTNKSHTKTRKKLFHFGELSKPAKKKARTQKVKVRARNKKGHYVADDKSTPEVNEAYTTKRVKKSKVNINKID